MSAPSAQLDARALAADAIQAGALQKWWEFAGLVNMVLDLKPRLIVEIGSDVGGSLRAWTQIAPQVYSISLDCGPFGSGKPLVPWGASVLDADSHSEDARGWLKGKLRGRRIDFLMIDGDHTYEGCLDDWAQYSPMVRPGGVVAFHDICWHGPQATCQVDAVWQKVKEGHRTMELIQTPTNWGGIGVLMK